MTDQARKMMEAREQGLSYKEISAMFGVSKQRVGQVLGQYNPNQFRSISETGCIYPIWRKWMNENMVSRYELLRRMGLQAVPRNGQVLGTYMKGEASPRKSYIDKLLKVTGLTYEELFYEEERE